MNSSRETSVAAPDPPTELNPGYAAFLSHSSKDAANATELCAHLESRSLNCWIAPRNVIGGREFADEIVTGISESKSFVLLVSNNSNGSPHILREVHKAHDLGRKVIPVFLEPVRLDRSLDYYIGPLHWIDASGGVLQWKADLIAAAIQGDESWKKLGTAPSLVRRWRYQRSSLLTSLWVSVLVVALAVAGFYFVSRQFLENRYASPLAGTWQAEMTDTSRQKHNCVVDIADSGWSVFSDGCPWPLTAKQSSLQASKDSVFAPNLFVFGKDEGTFQTLSGGDNFSGTFRFEGRNHLITHDLTFGETDWHKTEKSRMNSRTDKIIPQTVAWPLADAPGIAQKALDFVRSKWRHDAVLLSMEAKLVGTAQAGIASVQSSAGGVEVDFTFYSPQARASVMFQPNPLVGMMQMPQPSLYTRNPSLPAAFLDLPAAFRTAQQRGLHGNLTSAELRNWPAGMTYGDAHPYGVEWVLDTDANERDSVAAVKKDAVLQEFCLDCATPMQCFQKYNALLPTPQCNQFPLQDVKTCEADWRATDAVRLRAALSACGRISKLQPRNRNLAEVVQSIEDRLRSAN